MLTLIANLFRRAEPDPGVPYRDAVAAPDATITYKPDLIRELQADHRELLRLFQALMKAHRLGDIDESVDQLKRFTYALRAHLLKENLHLYVYLKHALRHDQESADLMAAMRIEMGKIGRALNDFVTRYTTSPWDANARESLRAELDKIAGILTHRIEQEEDVLYPMYMPPSRYR